MSGHGYHGHHKKHGKSSRRESHSKSFSEPSSQGYLESQQAQQATTVTPSFLFVVNRLELNELSAEGGVSPRYDDFGHWSPPLYAAGFSTGRQGTLYRWDNGVVSRATVPNGEIEFYRAVTLCYCNPFYQFVVADGDASVGERVDPTVDEPQIRWFPFSFRHHGTVSYLDFAGEHDYMAGNDARHIHPLGLDSYQHRDHNAPRSGGLAGNLAMLVGLVAFSCSGRDLETVLLNDQAWHRCQWNGHRRHNGRRDARTEVISIYFDPRNPSGSNHVALAQLEWDLGPLLS